MSSSSADSNSRASRDEFAARRHAAVAGLSHRSWIHPDDNHCWTISRAALLKLRTSTVEQRARIGQPSQALCVASRRAQRLAVDVHVICVIEHACAAVQLEGASAERPRGPARLEPHASLRLAQPLPERTLQRLTDRALRAATPHGRTTAASAGCAPALPSPRSARSLYRPLSRARPLPRRPHRAAARAPVHRPAASENPPKPSCTRRPPRRHGPTRAAGRACRRDRAAIPGWA